MPKMKNIYIFFVLMVNSYHIRWCTDGKCKIKMIAKKKITFELLAFTDTSIELTIYFITQVY